MLIWKKASPDHVRFAPRLYLGLTIVAAVVSSTPANAAEDISQLQIRSMLSDGRGFGAKICSTGALSTKDDIKPKAWHKIQIKCSVYAMGHIAKFGKSKEGEIYSVCIGGALEGCQRAVGVETPCLDLKSCRASLGVP